jgi:hypothetical protein
MGDARHVCADKAIRMDERAMLGGENFCVCMSEFGGIMTVDMDPWVLNLNGLLDVT